VDVDVVGRAPLLDGDRQQRVRPEDRQARGLSADSQPLLVAFFDTAR
jgi:hypothetical protein